MFERVTDPEILRGYLTDASNLAGGHAEALVRPRTVDELREVVAHCQREAIGLTVTAGRTSTTGGPVPFGGWLLSVEHLDEVLAIGRDRATAQAGARPGPLQDRIEATGRLFPPDPTSRYECTLGAAIACNASGARSFRYGPTRPWIAAVALVLPTGELVRATRETPIPAGWPAPAWTEPPVKTAAGYAPADNLLDLLIGHEGTLGIIVEAELRLTDLPADVVGILAFFADRAAAVRCMVDARAAARADRAGPISPRCIEYLDAGCLALIADRVGGVPAGAGAAIFFEQELQGDADPYLQAWLELLADHGGALADDTIVAQTDATRRQLHAMRHAIPAGINEQVVHNRMPKVGTDLAVPDSALDAIFARYEACPLPSLTFGHLGDNHLHCNVLPRTAEELELARAWYSALAADAVAWGGTISAEHGIGKLKRALLARQVGAETIAGFAALKRHVDPAWILGRGNLLDAPSSISAPARAASAM
jgi:D-lactate dehydrogenase (cytochrome)